MFICIGEDISVSVCLFVIIFLVCVCFDFVYRIFEMFLIFFVLSCILLSLRALCRHAVVIFANLVCLYLDTCFDILTCMSVNCFCNFII